MGSLALTSTEEAEAIKIMRAILLLFGGLALTSAFFRGYRNSRTWGTGPQRKVIASANQRRARQLFEAEMSSCFSCKNQLDGPVCGSDGRTYPSACSLKQQSCKMMRRQGRSFQSSMLKIEQFTRAVARRLVTGWR